MWIELPATPSWLRDLVLGGFDLVEVGAPTTSWQKTSRVDSVRFGYRASMAQDERRKHARLAINVDVDFTSRDNFYSGQTRDVSAGGVFIVTDVALPIGAHLALHLKLLGATIQALGEVTWVLLGDADEVIGVGVRFLNLSAPARTKIEAFMKRRTPMPFEMLEPDPTSTRAPDIAPAAPAPAAPPPMTVTAADKPQPARPQPAGRTAAGSPRPGARPPPPPALKKPPGPR